MIYISIIFICFLIHKIGNDRREKIREKSEYEQKMRIRLGYRHDY